MLWLPVILTDYLALAFTDLLLYTRLLCAPVAQLDRVSPSEGEGHRFDSCQVRQLAVIFLQ